MTTLNARKGLVLLLVCLAQFMVILDLAIVNVALPSIQRDLALRQSTLQWIVTAYGLLFGGFLLLGGRLGDLLGRRRIFLVGLAIFTGASLLAGVAQSAELLIGARAIQGFGAALVAPSALSILAVTFAEGAERNRALGIFGAVGASSASIGVIASGLLTDGPGWRWIFFINIPIGLLLLALAARNLPADAIHGGARQYDAAGAGTVTGGLLLFVYGLSRGVDHGWTTATTLALFAASAVLLAAFVRVESRTRAPLLPGAALRNRTMIAADLAAFLLFGAFFSFIFLGTLLMQQRLGYSPTRTGLAWLATSLTGFVAAGVAGARLVTVLGVRRLLVVGMSLLAVGVAWLTRVSPGANYVTDLLPGLLLAGIAIGLTGPAVQIGALSGVSAPQVGLASGLIETMREVGGAVGLAVVATVLVSRTDDASEATAFDGFQSAFVVIAALATLGAFVASVAFPDAAPAASARPSNEVVILPNASTAD
jgi:EmrB/QacA subfamily drug resistance transporter